MNPKSTEGFTESRKYLFKREGVAFLSTTTEHLNLYLAANNFKFP
jgi:hypothetical protein